MKKRAVIVDETIRTTVLPAKVETTLASFMASVDAYDVAAFDGWQGKGLFPDKTSPRQLWDAIGKLACLESDWFPFKEQLILQGESEVACLCGTHFVTAFLIRHRWSLVVLGRQSLLAPVSELLPVRTKTLETLGRILPELAKGGRTAEPPVGAPRGGGAGGAGPAELGIPLWWARGRN